MAGACRPVRSNWPEARDCTLFAADYHVTDMARQHRFRRRLARRLRPLRRLSRLQWLLTALMLLAVIGGSTALTLLLRGPTPPPAYTASAPPIALPSTTSTPNGTSAATATPTVTTPKTIRLIISAAGINLPVIQGDGVVVPLHLAMHYPGTDQPGGGSNALYYAHAQPGMFQGLYRLHPGDAIRALRSDGSEVDYKAASFKQVPYNDRAVLAPTPFDEITLLTCTSYDPYTPRYIVIGLPA
jgi:LPXTG-site transpeptidase (sortase) family protein